MSEVFKFAYITFCFGIALVSYFFCKNKRDWFWLTAALGFTLAADFFLILHDWHLPGVAVFCFAHSAYIARARIQGDGSFDTPAILRRVGRTVRLPMTLLTALAFTWLDAIFVVTALYAALFITNIYVSARYLRHNRKLAITGLLLFAACDICVLIFNLPVYMGAPDWLRGIFPLIFVFYLPAQGLLAVSAVDFRRKKSYTLCNDELPSE